MSRWSSTVLVTLVLSLIAPASAFGQASEVAGSSDSSRADRARESFRAGSRAVEEERWSDAVGHFGHAYDLVESPTALYNMGVALRALGRYRRAREVFERLLDRHGAQLDEGVRRSAEKLRREVGRKVAVLELAGLGPDARHEVRIDERDVPDEGERPLTVECDPGTHYLTASREGFETWEWRGRTQAGERKRLTVSLVPEPTDDEGGVWRSPWLWGITAAVVVVAGGVTAAVMLRDVRELSPNQDKVVRF